MERRRMPVSRGKTQKKKDRWQDRWASDRWHTGATEPKCSADKTFKDGIKVGRNEDRTARGGAQTPCHRKKAEI